jgi:threonine synthase
MRYVSTRGRAPALSFEEAMLGGLARDGGLYVPESVPAMAPGAIAALAGLTYEIAPLIQLDTGLFVQELFHGPTLAFKDMAMQLIGQMFEAVLKRRGERLTIVGATSGDTGSAAIEAFRGLDKVDVFILYPHGRVSEVQRRQMTTPAEPNVHALAVEGDFDDCQALVKAMFNDHAFRDAVGLAAVNSINWARVLAQTVYYFTAAVALGAPARPVAFCVPTGNFGDIYAGHVARRMGLPVSRLVIATNENDILHRTLEEGIYERRGVVATSAPSMDIQVSSNFERLLFELLDGDGRALAQLMDELAATGRFAVSRGALERLREGFASARIGVAAGRACRGDPAVPMVALGTAHAAKFPDAVEAACGIRPPLPERLADLYEREEWITPIRNDLAAVETLIRERRGAH